MGRKYPATALYAILLISSPGCKMSPEELRTNVYTASETGDYELLTKVLGQDAEYASDNSGKNDITPLHIASDAKIAELLIEKGADVDAMDANHNTPLHTAKTAEVVRVLLKHSPYLQAENKRKQRPIDTAANAEIARLLIDRGADWKRNNNKGFRSAITQGRADIVALYLEKGADPGMKFGSKQTAIHIAAKYGHAGVIKALVDAGADVNAKARYGQTPLHLAALHGKAAAAKSLLEAGANPNPELSSHVAVVQFGGTQRRGPMPNGSIWGNRKNASRATPLSITKSAAVKDVLRKYGGTE